MRNPEESRRFNGAGQGEARRGGVWGRVDQGQEGEGLDLVAGERYGGTELFKVE